MVFEHEELWKEIGGPTKAGIAETLSFSPGTSGLSFLDKISLPFDRYILHSVVVEWKPSCGTTKDGAIVIGVDWDALGNVTSMQNVQTLLPRIRCPVWQSQSMVIPPSRLMSRRFLFVGASTEAAKLAIADRASFALCVLSTLAEKASPVGEIWVRYKISLEGPTSEHVAASLNA